MKGIYKMATNWAYNYLTSKKTPCGKLKNSKPKLSSGNGFPKIRTNTSS